MAVLLGKLFTLAMMIALLMWVVHLTSSVPPTSTRAGTIDLSEAGSSVTVHPDGTRPFVITIVPIGSWSFLLGAPIPDADLRLKVVTPGGSFTAGRELMTASALHDNDLTIMLWNRVYGGWFAGGPVTVTVERPARAYAKAMAWRLVEGGEQGVER